MCYNIQSEATWYIVTLALFVATMKSHRYSKII